MACFKDGFFIAWITTGWDSNRMLRINLIIGDRFKPLSYCLSTFNAKNFTLVSGPSVSLNNIITKRIKRRQIQLVRKI